MKTQSIFSTLLLLIALCGPARAQESLVWHKGEAVLTTGLTIRGELCYQPRADVLLFRQAGKTRTYTADNLLRFHYTDIATSIAYTYGVYDVPQPTGETRAIVFNELIPGAAIQLLQLPDPHTERWAKIQGLPRNRSANWQTPRPWYVWLDGRFVAPDAFVDSELDGLIAAAPKAVQQWANEFTRPGNPTALARWLAYFNGRMVQEQLPGQQTPNQPITAWISAY